MFFFVHFYFCFLSFFALAYTYISIVITDTQQASDTALFIASVAEYLPPLLQYLWT
jgi:hypothetical protein